MVRLNFVIYWLCQCMVWFKVIYFKLIFVDQGVVFCEDKYKMFQFVIVNFSSKKYIIICLLKILQIKIGYKYLFFFFLELNSDG